MKLSRKDVSNSAGSKKTYKTKELSVLKSKMSNVTGYVRRNKRWTKEENDLLKKISDMRRKTDFKGEEQPDQESTYEGLSKLLGRTKAGVIKHWQTKKLYVSKKTNRKK